MSMLEVPPGMDLTETVAPDIIAAVTVLWVGGLAFAGLRWWARRVSKQQLGWDDWLCFFAVIPFTATCIANYIGVHYGAGRHQIAVIMENPSNIQRFLQYIYAVEILYPFIIGPIKCSICCLYLRLFSVNKIMRMYIRCLIVTTILWAIGLLLGSIFQCTPVGDAWHPMGDRTNCVDLRVFLVGTNVPNIVIDFLILIAPIEPIWKLHLPFKKRIMIVSILMLGAGEVAFSIVRLARLVELSTVDATWDYFDAIVWSTVEQAVGIICVSLPVMGPLLPRSITGRTRGSSGYGNYKHSHSGSSHVLEGMNRKNFGKLNNDSMGENIVDGNNIRRTTEVRLDYQSEQ